MPFIYPYFIWFVMNFFFFFFFVITLLFFKRITHGYLLKMSITYNKKRICILNSLCNCISVRSTPKILSIKDEYAFLFSNFSIAGLCNSTANSLFEIFLFLTARPEVFNQKTYKPLKQDPLDIHHIF